MGEVSVRAIACYPWSLAAGPWAFRRAARADVHISRDAVRITPRGWRAGRVPTLVIPMRLVAGLEWRWGMVWIRAHADRGDPVGLRSSPATPRLAAALRAAGVPEGSTVERRTRGWSRPGVRLLALLAAAATVVLVTADNDAWSRWVAPAIWTALIAWFFALAPLGPYGGQCLRLTPAGWVEEPQTQPAPV